MPREFFVTAPTRNGSRFTAQLLGRLGIKTTYATVEIFPFCVESCKLDIHATMNHHLTRQNTKKGSIRLIRHPAAGFSSYHAWLKTLYLNGAEMSLQAALDGWLVCGAGPLLMLGYIEEYFLQNALLKATLQEEAFFSFEKMKEGPQELARLLHFVEVNVPFERIVAIHADQLAEDAISDRNRSKSTQYDDLLARRINIMAEACGDTFGYIYQPDSTSNPKCSWPDSILEEAAGLYRNFYKYRVPRAVSSVNVTLLDSILHSMYQHLDSIPALGIQLAGFGLLKRKDKFYVDYLSKYIQQDDKPFLCVMALSFLSMCHKKFSSILLRKINRLNAHFNQSPWFSAGVTPYTEMMSSMLSIIQGYMKFLSVQEKKKNNIMPHS